MLRTAPRLLIFLFLTPLLFVFTATEGNAQRIYNKSDILFSKRFETSDLSFLDIASSFQANRLVWHYGGNTVGATRPDTTQVSPPGRVITAFQNYDSEPQCAIPAFVADNDPQDIHCRDLEGNLVKAPWEASWPGVSRGDVLKSAYLEVQRQEVKVLVQRGCRSLQQDSVAQNIHTLFWDGCFSAEGDNKFREYLRGSLSSDQLSSHGITDLDNFSYRAHLISQGALDLPIDSNGNRSFGPWLSDPKLKPHSLITEYRNFSALMTSEYLNYLKTSAHEFLGRPVPLAGNSYYTDLDYELYQALDFITSEIAPTNRTPYGFIALAAFSGRSGKHYVGTLPSNDVSLNRSLFSLAYALGLHMILPYDVYIPDVVTAEGRTPSPRFTASVSEFSDLTDFIVRNASLIDGYSGLETYGQDNLSVITSVSQVNGRLRLTHSSSSISQQIPAGSSIWINRKQYLTIADTTVGYLYLPLSASDELGSADREMLPVEKIEYPDGSGHLLQIPLRPGFSPITKIERLWSRRYRVSFLKTSDIIVRAGARIRIGKTSYTTLSTTGYGSIDIDPLEAGVPKLGELVIQVRNPFGLQGVHNILPTTSAPRVTYVDYDKTKSGMTTVRLSDGQTYIPLGTRYQFAQTGADVSTEKFYSEVGNLYLPGNLLGHIFPGQAVLNITRPGEETVSYRQPLNSKSNVTISNRVGKLIASVRKNSEGKTAIHFVNLNKTPVSANVNFRASLFKAGNLVQPSCILSTADGLPQESFSPVDRGNGLYGIYVRNLRSWAILTCN